MKRRLLGLFLLSVLLLSTVLFLFSCAEKQRRPELSDQLSTVVLTDEPGGNYIRTKVPDGLRFDSDGTTVINFAVSESGDNDGFHLRSIKLDDPDTTNKVDAAVFERNQRIEEKLGVEINVLWYGTSNIRSSEVNISLANGDADYDIICGRQFDDVAVCLEGNLADLTKLYDGSQKIDYINFSAPYWSTYYIDAMKCGDAVYWLTGDLCLRYTGGFYCVFCNSYVYERYLEAEYGNIYSLVKEGKWTLDLWNQMTLKAYENLDGNDALSEDDLAGAVIPVWDNTNGLALAAGVNWSSRNDDGSIKLDFTKDNANMIEFVNKFRTILTNGRVIRYSGTAEGGNYPRALELLASDRACFVPGRLVQAETYLKNMEHDYYILPCPKLNSDQKNYRSSVHDAINLYAISNSSENKAAAAATLEELAFENYYNVRPIYYDEALKYMYSRDQGAADMIDLMGESVYSDFVYIWQFTSYFPDMGGFLRFNAEAKRIASALERHTTQWLQGTEDVQKDIKELFIQ